MFQIPWHFQVFQTSGHRERTDESMPDDVEYETVEEAGDGGEETERERLLMIIHLHLIQDPSQTHSQTNDL